MNWEAIGAIGEITGATAVVITLIYLAVQVRQNSQNQHSSTSWAITQTLDALIARISSDAELTDIWLRGRRDLDDLNPIEHERFRTYAMALVNLTIYVHEHPTEEHQYLNQFLAGVVQDSPGLRVTIDSFRSLLPPALYRQLVNDV